VASSEQFTASGDAIDDLNEIVRLSTVMLRKGAPVTEETKAGVRSVHVWMMPHGDEAPTEMPRVDVHFFTVGIRPEVEALKPALLTALRGCPEPERLADGPSYIELGGMLGDQGQALRLFGLGEYLGLWKVITPATLGIEGPDADAMAGMGMVMCSGYKQRAVS
jgi:hypothetical protein